MRFFVCFFLLALVGVFSGYAEDASPPSTALSTVVGKRLTFANGLLSRKFYRMAEKEYRLVIHDFPDSPSVPEAYSGLSKALQGQGKNKEALKVIETIERRWPTRATLDTIRLDHGYLLLQLNRPEEAEAVLTPVTKATRSETREAAWYFIAQALEKRQKTQKAMKIYVSLASKPLDANHVYRPYAVLTVLTSEVKTGLDQAVKRLEKLLSGEHAPESVKEQALRLCAVNAYAGGRYSMAADLYQKYVDRFPDAAFCAAARKGKLRAMYQSGSSKSILSYVEHLKRMPELANDPEVLFIQAATLVRENQSASALPLLQAVCEQPQVSEEMARQAALLRLGAWMNTGKYARALTAGRDFAEKYSQEPGRSDALYVAGTAAFQLEKYATAEPLLTAVSKSTNIAPEKGRRAGLLLAQCLQKQDKFAESARAYRALSGKTPFDDMRATDRLYAAAMAEKAGNLDAAWVDYQAIVTGTRADTPNNLRAVNAMIRLSFKKGDFDQAAALLNKLITTTQGETQFRTRLALILAYLQADKIKACEEEIKKAGKSQSMGNLGPELDYAIVRVSIRQKKMDRALAVFKKLLALSADKQPDYRAGSLAVLAKAFFSRNDFAESEKTCEKWMAAVPAKEQFEPTARLAYIYLATARYKEAERVLRKLSAKSTAFKLTPRQSAQVLSLTGETLLKQGRDAQAFRAFEKSLEKGAADAETSARSHWGLALLLKRANRLDEALKQAVGGFVLGNDPRYTPRSMVLAADIFESQGKTKEAANTRAELKTRFPDFVP